MTVLVLGVVVLLLFGIIDVTTSQGVNAPPSTIAIFGGLSVDATSTLLKGCETAAAPPNDISPAYIVPAGTMAAGAIDWRGSGPGGYDCQRRLYVTAAQGAVLGFYVDELQAEGWSVFSRGGGPNGQQQILLDRSGSDTFQWVAGITIDAHSATSTTWTLRFYQNDALD
jgi:hypothetical protein